MDYNLKIKTTRYQKTKTRLKSSRKNMQLQQRETQKQISGEGNKKKRNEFVEQCL